MTDITNEAGPADAREALTQMQKAVHQHLAPHSDLGAEEDDRGCLSCLMIAHAALSATVPDVGQGDQGWACAKCHCIATEHRAGGVSQGCVFEPRSTAPTLTPDAVALEFWSTYRKAGIRAAVTSNLRGSPHE